MIIARSPLRISLGGGGTDLPSYYKKKMGLFYQQRSINMYTLQLQDHFKQEFI